LNTNLLFSAVYRNGLWISGIVFGISAALLVFFVFNIIKLSDKSKVLSVPLLPRQEIEFPVAGPVILCIEGPLLTKRFANLDYELRGHDRMPIEGRTTWFHGKTSSFSKVRMEMMSYQIPMPGRYMLRIQGLESGSTPDSDHHIVFVRPHLALTIVYVIGITLSGVLTVGSIVLFFLRLTSNLNP